MKKQNKKIINYMVNDIYNAVEYLLYQHSDNNVYYFDEENKIGVGLRTEIYIDGKNISFEEISETLDFYFSTIHSDIYLIVNEKVYKTTLCNIFTYYKSDYSKIDIFTLHNNSNTELIIKDELITDKLLDKYTADIIDTIIKYNKGEL